mmetsp:Transcript_3168/g.5065  ORF Transcript_3168/g.5065 Transcript_3168/m.5065 type:complete len:349 (-) Transcript_3168:40-1086(-)
MSKWLSSKRAIAPADLVKATLESISTLQANLAEKGKAYEKAQEDIAQKLVAMKILLYGNQDRPVDEDLANKLCDEAIAQNLALPLISHLEHYQFECKKDAASVFNNLLRKKIEQDGVEVYRFCDHIASQPHIIDMLIDGYSVPDIALACGTMLREVICYEPLCSVVLHSEPVWLFFDFVQVSNFDISSDALATFRELLTKHRTLVAKFLKDNFDRFFESYKKLLTSENYVTRRQSVKLLGEIIVHRSNFDIMSKYIASRAQLMLMMNLLRDKSKSIQYEAFHVFKVFVANPNKPAEISDIIVRNKERLVAFLKQFRNDIEDEQFIREKAYLIKEIEASGSTPAPAADK